MPESGNAIRRNRRAGARTTWSWTTWAWRRSRRRRSLLLWSGARRSCSTWAAARPSARAMFRARWASRPRLGRALAELAPGRSLVLVSQDDALARLAARDARELFDGRVAVLEGGTAAWRAVGLSLDASPDEPPDGDRIETLFWAHDRHAGNRAAMRLYLDWEQALPARIAADGDVVFTPREDAAP